MAKKKKEESKALIPIEVSITTVNKDIDTGSEFGKGFIYNLILFSKHSYLHLEFLKNYAELRKLHPDKPEFFTDESALALWFNAASDHFYDFEVPLQWKNNEIGKLAEEIRSRTLYFGHGFRMNPTIEDFKDIENKIELLARLVDKELGIDDIEAQYK